MDVAGLFGALWEFTLLCVHTLHNKEKICSVKTVLWLFPPSICISLHGCDVALRLNRSQATCFWRFNRCVKLPEKSEITFLLQTRLGWIWKSDYETSNPLLQLLHAGCVAKQCMCIYSAWLWTSGLFKILFYLFCTNTNTNKHTVQKREHPRFPSFLECKQEEALLGKHIVRADNPFKSKMTLVWMSYVKASAGRDRLAWHLITDDISLIFYR